MPDTPTPTLREAAEALLRLFDESGHFRGSIELFRAETGAPACPWQHPANSEWIRKYEAWERKHALALRAALAAEDAWRARAEAAIRAMADALDHWRHEGCPACGGDCASANPPMVGCPLQALHHADAARRRYEETCRG